MNGWPPIVIGSLWWLIVGLEMGSGGPWPVQLIYAAVAVANTFLALKESRRSS